MIRTLILFGLLFCLTLSEIPALDFSGYERRGVDWEEAAIAKPPKAIRDRMAGRAMRVIVLRNPIYIDQAGVYDFRNVVHVAKFSKECDQTEGRPPMLHVRAGGVTIRNWIGVGTGHDGIHVHSGRGQGLRSREVVEGVRFERCWQQACEDALTIGMNTRDLRFDLCGFLPNPNGEFRDKLAQLNHADGVVFSRCYFGPTKNAIEFKSGARLVVERSVMDHCSTGLRVDTSDSYRSIIPHLATSVKTTACRFHRCHHPAHLTGSVRWESRGDEFDHTMRSIKADGAVIDRR